MIKKLIYRIRHTRTRTKQTAAVIAVCIVILAATPISKINEPVIASTIGIPPTAAPTTTLTDEPAHTLDTTPTLTSEPPKMLPHMEELFLKNSDLAGWLKIEGTVIDYPVMFTPHDGEFYLYRKFDKEDDPTKEGTLFIDKNCTIDPPGANILIHGHNMKNGTMFNTLLKYKNEEFYKQHPTFEYSTLFDTGEYEIVAVFLSKVYYVTDNVFKYYKFFDAETQAEYDEYITNIKALALYETGVTAEFGDQLVTLSTCEYSVENGRLVVVGRKMPTETTSR